MENMIMEFGLKDGLFAGMFIWLFIYQLRTSQLREDKLFSFLDVMKEEFSKLVGSYERLSVDVNDIKKDLHNKVDKIQDKERDDL